MVVAMAIQAVIFDLDGVLVDSEQVWNELREAYTRDHGGRWEADAQRAMMGMSSLEWSRYMHDELGVRVEPERISEEVAAGVAERYLEALPLMPDAQGAVERIAERWPVAIASSANRPLIDLVLELSGLAAVVPVSVSSEEVERGKPAPDVYLEAAARLEADPARCAAVEDSTNGLLSARRAGMWVIAIPNRAFPPAPEGLAAAAVVLDSLDRLGPAEVDPTA
jgi:HAD superfamily hydrolase (TIGR01509 family)